MLTGTPGQQPIVLPLTAAAGAEKDKVAEKADAEEEGAASDGRCTCCDGNSRALLRNFSYWHTLFTVSTATAVIAAGGPCSQHREAYMQSDSLPRPVPCGTTQMDPKEITSHEHSPHVHNKGMSTILTHAGESKPGEPPRPVVMSTVMIFGDEKAVEIAERMVWEAVENKEQKVGVGLRAYTKLLFYCCYI